MEVKTLNEFTSRWNLANDLEKKLLDIGIETVNDLVIYSNDEIIMDDLKRLLETEEEFEDVLRAIRELKDVEDDFVLIEEELDERNEENEETEEVKKEEVKEFIAVSESKELEEEEEERILIASVVVIPAVDEESNVLLLDRVLKCEAVASLLTQEAAKRVSTEEELEARLAKAQQLAKEASKDRERRRELKTEIIRAEAVAKKSVAISILEQNLHFESTFDLCFVMDITGSMSSHISATKNDIFSLVQELGSFYPDIPLRLGFVGYRDHCNGSDCLTIEPFSLNVEKFKQKGSVLSCLIE